MTQQVSNHSGTISRITGNVPFARSHTSHVVPMGKGTDFKVGYPVEAVSMTVYTAGVLLFVFRIFVERGE